MSDITVTEEQEKLISEALVLLKMDQNKSLDLVDKVVVWFKLLVLDGEILKVARARFARMDFSEARNSKTCASDHYSALFAEWMNVHSKDARDLLPLKGDEQGLADLLDQWERDPGREKVVKEKDESDRKSWVEPRSQWPVFKALVDGVADQDGDDAKLDKLLANFKSVGATSFKYTMVALDSDKFLQGGGEGDCNTLMHAFRNICQNVFGIECEIQNSTMVEFPDKFLTPAHKTIDGLTGNVQGKDREYWLFENHYWIQSGGKDYDVLFGEPGRPNIDSWLKMQNSDREAVWIFGKEPAQVKIKLINKDVVKGRYQQVD
jgi:hypothetical protein